MRGGGEGGEGVWNKGKGGGEKSHGCKSWLLQKGGGWVDGGKRGEPKVRVGFCVWSLVSVLCILISGLKFSPKKKKKNSYSLRHGLRWEGFAVGRVKG